jgi:glucose/arabinose dehydrogenase
MASLPGRLRPAPTTWIAGRLEAAPTTACVAAASTREGEFSPTGQLKRLVFNEKWDLYREEALLRDLHQRIRDVRQGPDGNLYVITDENDSALLKIEPADAAPKTN